MSTPIATLAQPIRPAATAKYLGELSLALVVISLVPPLVTLLLDFPAFSVAQCLPPLIFAAIGWPLARLPPVATLRSNEALVIGGGIFVFASAVLTLPLLDRLPPVDAWFETVSALTTTGLSTLPDSHSLTRSQLFTRAWLQWSGGLGVVVLSLLLLIGPGAVAKRLAQMESHGEDIVGGTRAIARQVLLVYLALTLAAAMLIAGAGASWFDALVHALTAVSTGGFSNYDDSLAGLGNGYAVSAIMVFSFCGALPLLLYYRSIHQDPRALWREPQVRYLLLCGALVASLVSWNLMHTLQLPWQEAVRHGALLAVSAQTTTGFSTYDVARLDAASKLLLIFAMAGGGSLGSTAGGMKIFRILIVLRLLQLALQRSAAPPHAVLQPRLGREKLEQFDIERALQIIGFFCALIAGSWLCFIAAGFPALDALFEVVSATATVGLSSGISQQCGSGLKLLLSLDMLAGRVEILALLVLLYPRTWRKAKHDH